MPKIKDLRVFSYILTAGFLVLGVLIPFLKGKSFNFYLITLAVVILFLGIFFPKILIPVRHYWIKIGDVLGKINSTILFTAIYFLIFSTIGLIFRLMKRDRLHKKFRGVKSTMVMKKEISPFSDPF